ncbi:MAG: hypothetical protein MJZ22_00440 [Candidatus Saccharibacteria bacterium]|nr:hypothetical protein [Candidatus Saccharibacteria bacterium]
MKKILCLLIVLTSVSFADSTYYLLGLRNSKHAMVGARYKNYGVVVENSLYVQSIDLQYIRASVFYRFDLPLNLSGYYALYSGIQYNRNFFDVGAVANLKWNPLGKYLQMSATIMPFYDSDLDRQFGYSFGIQTIPLSEIGLFVNLKNIPDYRVLENRLAAGLVFVFEHMTVKPEISVPLDFNLDYARVSVSFVYENLF